MKEHAKHSSDPATLRGAFAHWTMRILRQWMRAPCLVCGQYAHGEELCLSCTARLMHTPWGVSSLDCGPIRIPVLWREAYGGPLTDTIYRSKYHGEWGAARLLGRCLGGLPRPWCGPRPIVIPVPLTGKRLGDRGYNQSLVIARQAARLWQVPVHALWLTKVRTTARQASLPHAQRQDNLSGSFAGSKKLHNQRVILIDDIMTSGETLREAARAVHACGGQVIAAAVIARVPKPRRMITSRVCEPRHVQRRSG